MKEGTASRSLPGQSPREFPHRSPPAAANLAHFYRVNISPSFQRPGPRETDSHLQPPLPSRSSPGCHRCLLLLPLGNAGGPPATAAPQLRSPRPARAHAPAPPSLRRPLSQRGRWGPTCGPCPAPPSPPALGFFTSLLLFSFPPPAFFSAPCVSRESRGAAPPPGSAGWAGTAALRGERT